MGPFVLVIGGGPAGLAAGYHLKKGGVGFVIVDNHGGVGDSWRTRYDSLTLFTPRQLSALPGLELLGNRDLYPSRDEFADYLERYASRFALPVQLDRRVVRLSKAGNDTFEAELDDGAKICADAVIVATGAFQHAVVPQLSKRFGYQVLQLTTDIYRSPGQLPDGPVLVVGDGASGRDIAVEVRKTQPVILATGRPRKLFPEHFLGKSTWWWLNGLGVIKAPAHSWVGSKVKRLDAFPNRDRSVKSMERHGVRIVPRLTHGSGTEARFADGTAVNLPTIIWATGYWEDSAWLDIGDAKAPDGAFLHNEGHSPVRGIYFVGRPWQRNRASALIMGMGADAETIVRRLLSDWRLR